MGITVGKTYPKKLSYSVQCSPTGTIKVSMAGTEQITNCLIYRSLNAVVAGDSEVTVTSGLQRNAHF